MNIIDLSYSSRFCIECCDLSEPTGVKQVVEQTSNTVSPLAFFKYGYKAINDCFEKICNRKVGTLGLAEHMGLNSTCVMLGRGLGFESLSTKSYSTNIALAFGLSVGMYSHFNFGRKKPVLALSLGLGAAFLSNHLLTPIETFMADFTAA